MSKTADLRIASKRAYYDNSKPFSESETITLYIYNAGPDLAEKPVVRAGYSYSMDWNTVTTTFRQAQVWHRPSEQIRDGSLTWTGWSSLTSLCKEWDMITTLPDVPAGILVELNLRFPMLRESSYKDYTLKASVRSSTADPRDTNNETTYTITPNHHDDGSDYWETPGNLANLDFNGLTALVPLSRADLRICSTRAHYNNNLPFGKSETLTFLVFNDGPATATRPLLRVGYTTSMDWENVSCSGEQVWVPDGINPSTDLDNYTWQSLGSLSCSIDNWDVICHLPDIPPSLLYRVKISFPMNHTTTYKDYTATATISSQATELDPSNNSTTYDITPNHNEDGDTYWEAKGNIAQLDGSPIPSGSRTCLSGWLEDTPIVVSKDEHYSQIPLKDLKLHLSAYKTNVASYDIGNKDLRAKLATEVEYRTCSDLVVLSFSTDKKTQLTYRVYPDTLLYLEPTIVKVGEDDVRIGYWIPVRMLWVGAAIRGMSPNGDLTLAYVTNIYQIDGTEYYRSTEYSSSVEPYMVSQSHSYVVGQFGKGGVLTHNPRDRYLSEDANVAAVLENLEDLASRLVSTTTPPPGLPSPRHGYCLRRRRPADPPRRSRPGPPVLPADVPRRDEDGNWLIYLWEEDTPGVVENARHAVESGHPWVLTYDRHGAAARRRQSTGRYQPQSELLQLSAAELAGPSGTIGQLDRDEYPPACSLEGGSGALVTYIEAGDNRRAGCLMQQQFQNYRITPQPDGHAPFPDNGRFRFAIIHDNMSVIEYLGDGLEDESQIERPYID
ncbi:nuclease [Aspergillus terreus]|uniref:Nuclease n=1 Tax=Aspergillus terreus TaxID=33178 RepID=A0A5M3YT19_ASPTE|nr:hypothetical protein ATETN484_0004000100 [Aspergillus terreus]GFF12891.1 nuclease [Aspergillus terreus]